MGFRLGDFAVAVLLNFVQCVYAEHILSCDASMLEPCPGKHQICNETSRECVCEPGAWAAEDGCVAGDAPAHHATTAVVVVFTLALVTCGLVLVVRKYNLVDYVRNKINMRRQNVMYEDVMIGHDDPPLSP